MKFAISNIGWSVEQDSRIYDLMRKYNFSGLEIAPTRIFSDKPYEKLEEAAKWKRQLEREYGFMVPSMQSIWFGRQEKIFGDENERKLLIDYTKKAIDFASAINCKNIVFGCPKNRNVPDGIDEKEAVSFFKELGDYAVAKGTVIGMEANPKIYNTNYINTTNSAFELIECVDSKGFLLNLDIGTMIQNEENIADLSGKIDLINHVHISEPGLKIIKNREIHKEVRNILKAENYQRFVSIEMGRVDEIADIENTMKYFRGIFD